MSSHVANLRFASALSASCGRPLSSALCEVNFLHEVWEEAMRSTELMGVVSGGLSDILKKNNEGADGDIEIQELLGALKEFSKFHQGTPFCPPVIKAIENHPSSP